MPRPLRNRVTLNHPHSLPMLNTAYLIAAQLIAAQLIAAQLIAAQLIAAQLIAAHRGQQMIKPGLAGQPRHGHRSIGNGVPDVGKSDVHDRFRADAES